MNAPIAEYFFERINKMPRVTFNSMSRKKSSVRRKRTSVLAKAKYKPRTAAANRTLIKSNAYAIRAVKKMLPPPVYCDWQYGGTMFADVDDTGAGNFTQTLLSRDLMTPNFWIARLRQDAVVNDAACTCVKRMSINLRYSMQQANYAQITLFIVTLRRNAANRIPAGAVDGEDYILSPSQDFNPRLNPAVFKVHYVRNISLTKGAWLEPPFNTTSGQIIGNPTTTFKKGEININPNITIRQPNLGAPWKTMTQAQLRPEQRYSILAFITSQGTNADAQTGARIDFDVLYTTYNAA